LEEYSGDVLVIGSGGAGLRAAIAAKERGAGKVLLLSKGTAGLGTATIISYGALASSGFGLSVEEHFQKTLETGYFTNNQSLVKRLCEDAPARIRELREKGARFAEIKYGVVAEGRFPILGRGMIETLLSWARSVEVQIVSWITAVDLVVIDERVVGCLGVTAAGKTILLRANAVVLCTGGASAIFRFHDNPVTNLGGGVAMASRCGVEVRDMEFVQFYPLLISAQGLPRVLTPPLLVEEGRIVNDIGEDILEKYGLLHLRPIAVRGRDKLSIAIYKEMAAGRKVFLDAREARQSDELTGSSDREMLQVLEARYQSKSRLLPVIPCAHFTMGGIAIDEHCKTSRPGLFSSGEASCGLHGANRMGGNALTETLVFGYRAGNEAASFSAERKSCDIKDLKEQNLLGQFPNYKTGKRGPSQALRELQAVMWQGCGPARDANGLSAALEKVETLKEEGLSCDRQADLGFALSVFNGLETAKIILKSAIERKESLGAHYRVD
jgi:fumarate reductase (CoM/CoB) subunit A